MTPGVCLSYLITMVSEDQCHGEKYPEAKSISTCTEEKEFWVYFRRGSGSPIKGVTSKELLWEFENVGYWL